MNIATGRITGLEALLRWQHPELGLVPPDKFIRTAENSGLILPIGEWVLRTACSQARKWQDEGLGAVSVAVNVSAVQFRQEDFCALIRKVLHETGLAPQYLELELTESLLLSSADLTFPVLQELKAMGVTLAIDDFGTGYSSFSYLRQFRVSKLKIDGSFIRDVAVNPDDAAITAAILSMAKNLNLKVHGTYFVRVGFPFSRIGSQPTPLSVTVPARCRTGTAWWFCCALQGLFFQCASHRHQHFFGLLCRQHCAIAGLTTRS